MKLRQTVGYCKVCNQLENLLPNGKCWECNYQDNKK